MAFVGLHCVIHTCVGSKRINIEYEKPKIKIIKNILHNIVATKDLKKKKKKKTLKTPPHQDMHHIVANAFSLL